MEITDQDILAECLRLGLSNLSDKDNGADNFSIAMARHGYSIDTRRWFYDWWRSRTGIFFFPLHHENRATLRTIIEHWLHFRKEYQID